MALLGVASGVLPSVGIIVFGGVLLHEVNSTNRLFAASMEHGTMMIPTARLLAQEHLSGAAGSVVLAGAASAILALGILALIITALSVTLTLVALLVFGVGVLAAGPAVQ